MTRLAPILALLAAVSVSAVANADDGSTQTTSVLSGEEIANALKPAGTKVSKSRGLSRRPDTAATQSINPALYQKLPFDATRDFTPLGLVATGPHGATALRLVRTYAA